jgi:hypothetical protein
MNKAQLKQFLREKSKPKPNQNSENKWGAHVCATIFELYNIPGVYPPRGVSVERVVDIYNTIRNSYGDINKNNTRNENNVIPVSEDDIFTQMWFMWLDGIHDSYLDMTFVQFLESRKGLFNEKHMNSLQKRASAGDFSTDVKFVIKQFGNVDEGFTNKFLIPATTGKRTYDNTKKRWFTPDVRDKKGTISIFTGSWESNFKSIIRNIYPNYVTINPASDKIEFPSYHYLTIDQEVSVSSPLSGLTLNSETLRPYITTGTLFDPGRTLVRDALRPDIITMASNTANSRKTIMTRSYFLGDLKIQFRLPSGENFMKVELTLDRNKLEYTLKVNGVDIPLNLTKGKAGKSTDIKDQAGKYFGDFLQLLYVLFFRRNNPNAGRRRYLGTGDSNFAMEYWFYNRIFRNNRAVNAPMNLIIDGGQAFRNTVFMYGAPSGYSITPIKIFNAPDPSGIGGAASGLKRPRNNNNVEVSSRPPPQKPRTNNGNNVNRLLQNSNTSGILLNKKDKVVQFKAWLNEDQGRKARFLELKKNGGESERNSIVKIISKIGSGSKGIPYDWKTQILRILRVNF